MTGRFTGRLRESFHLYGGISEILEEMLMLLGEKYDGMPSLEYADVSGFGLWGEGHHGCRPTPDGPVVDLELGSRERMEEVVRRLIDSHQRAFPA